MRYQQCILLLLSGTKWAFIKSTTCRRSRQLNDVTCIVIPHICSSTKATEQNSLSAAQDKFIMRCNEYIISPFSGNNMVAPARNADLPYHFQLDEHGLALGWWRMRWNQREREKDTPGKFTPAKKKKGCDKNKYKTWEGILWEKRKWCTKCLCHDPVQLF